MTTQSRITKSNIIIVNKQERPCNSFSMTEKMGGGRGCLLLLILVGEIPPQLEYVAV